MNLKTLSRGLAISAALMLIFSESLALEGSTGITVQNGSATVSMTGTTGIHASTANSTPGDDEVPYYNSSDNLATESNFTYDPDTDTLHANTFNSSCTPANGDCRTVYPHNTAEDSAPGAGNSDIFAEETGPHFFFRHESGDALIFDWTVIADLPAAGCNEGTGAPIWDIPSSNGAGAACFGTNFPRGVLDFDTTNQETAYTSIMLEDWDTALAMDVDIYWVATATSGNVEFELSTICIGDSEDSDPSWNTASSTGTVTVDATTTDLNTSTISGLTMTGCAAGEIMHLRLQRDVATDTMAGDARVLRVVLKQS